jgi:hypothetical protein
MEKRILVYTHWVGYGGLGDYQVKTALKNVQNVSKWCKESLQILAGLRFGVLGIIR